MLIFPVMIPRPRSSPVFFSILFMPIEVISILPIFCQNLIHIILINRPQFHFLYLLVFTSPNLSHHVFYLHFWLIQDNYLTFEPPILIILDHSYLFYLAILLEQFLYVVVWVVSIYVLYVNAFILFVAYFALYLVSVHRWAYWVYVFQFLHVLLYLLLLPLKGQLNFLHVDIAHVTSWGHTEMYDIAILECPLLQWLKLCLLAFTLFLNISAMSWVRVHNDHFQLRKKYCSMKLGYWRVV